MTRDIALIIEELAIAACEQGINADELAERVRRAAIEQDIAESGDEDGK